jgi:thiosulfate/3-mercaptopyruvate sulfurtransferase
MNEMTTPLVSAEWLARRLGAADMLILDIRSAVDGGGRAAYEEAHVPGAIHSDYVRAGWRMTRGMVSGLLPERAHLVALFSSLGLTPAHHVVIVSAGSGAGDFSAAARVYWTLKAAGHARLSLLDGGMAAWRADPSRPIERGPGSPPHPSPDYPVCFAPELRATTEDVERAVAGNETVLLDSRAHGFFIGDSQSPQALRPGRLPGAIHLDHAQAFDPATKGLKPLSQLHTLYAGVPAGPVVNYCNTGHQAATNWFILSELLTRPNVSLYDGSMSDWTQDDAHPVETGEARKPA